MSAAVKPAPVQPREITLLEVRINGLYMREKRRAAHVTLSQAARNLGISRQHLSRMERGAATFQKEYAEACERFFARRMRAGEE